VTEKLDRRVQSFITDPPHFREPFCEVALQRHQGVVHGGGEVDGQEGADRRLLGTHRFVPIVRTYVADTETVFEERPKWRAELCDATV
jgi:hypothetical protein